MNRSSLNTTPLNGAPLNVLQRLAIQMVAIAQVAQIGRVKARAIVNAVARASVEITARAFINGAIALTPTASIGLGGFNRHRLRVEFAAVAQVSPGGQVVPRGEVNEPMEVAPRAGVTTVARAMRRGPIESNPSAAITIAPARTWAYVNAVVNVQALASVDVGGATRKQIPYDEDAPMERTMVVAQEIREMVVY